MSNIIEKVLVSEQEIAKRINEIAKKISNDYTSIQEPLLMVCLLKGAAIFTSDLMRKIDLPVHLDFMIVSSYGDETQSSSEVRIIKDLQEAIQGKHVLIVDDIIDTGHTLQKVSELLQSRNPASIKTCVLLDKKERRVTNSEADYKGFVIPNEFVVGYGLDYAQSYRNLPFIGVLNPTLY